MSQIIASVIAVIVISGSGTASEMDLTHSMINVPTVEACRAVVTQSATMAFGRNVDAKCLDGNTGAKIVQIRCMKDGFFSPTMSCKDITK